jgi:ATP-dependent helicase/nuclease subunit B
MPQSPKSGFSGALAGFSARWPVAEKRLLAPSRRVGHQWLYGLARAGTSCLNWRVETLRSVAVELAAPAMARSGLTVASSLAVTLLVERSLAASGRSLKYLHGVNDNGGLAAGLGRTINALRLEGVGAGRLRPGLLEDDFKAADLRCILAGYLELLGREGLVDYGGILEMALQRLVADPDALGCGTIVLVPADLERRGLEVALLDSLPAERLVELPVEEDGLPPVLHFGSSVGEMNEVRNVLRTCLAEGVPFDEVELLHTDADVYIPLLLETFDSIDRPGGGDDAPLTFAEGVPCESSRPGRALAAWLRWLGEDCPQGILTEMIREGLLTVDEGWEEDWGRLAGLLRGSGVGFGRERYLGRIDDLITSLRHRIERAGEDGEMEDQLGRPVFVSRAGMKRDLNSLNALKEIVGRLLELSPLPGDDGGVWITAARRFLGECARTANRVDNFARQRLDEELAGMLHWHDRAGGDHSDVRSWIAALPRKTRVLGSGPRPGSLHVDHVMSGGHSGRRRLFILGLDDRRFPGAGLQDPLLLDGERARLSPGMPSAGERLEERLAAFRRLLARQIGETTLSWSCLDVISDSELYPGPTVLDAYRTYSERPSTDPREFLDGLPLPSSFAPAEEGKELDLTEWWLRRLTGEEMVTSGRDLLLREAPHLSRGIEASAARRKAGFTSWDGRVPAAGANLDPTSVKGKVVSSNSLETAGACPLRFFFRYGLEIEPPKDTVVDPSRWLDPLVRGSLLHDVFEDFLRGFAGTGRAPSFAEDGKILAALLEKKVARVRDRYPPPSEAAFISMVGELRRIAETFLKAEDVYQREERNEPVYLEVSIGMPSRDNGTELDDPEALAVALPGGGTIKTRGRVDRIDRRRDGGWVIWDYKTGSSYGFGLATPFDEGRKVQSWLYLRIIEARLRKVISPEEKVHSFGYFFPGLRAAGQRIEWETEILEAGGKVVANLCRLISSGAFLPTTDSGKDCRYCDYLPVCDDVESLAEGARRKILESEPLLGPLVALRKESLEK